MGGQGSLRTQQVALLKTSFVDDIQNSNQLSWVINQVLPTNIWCSKFWRNWPDLGNWKFMDQFNFNFQFNLWILNILLQYTEHYKRFRLDAKSISKYILQYIQKINGNSHNLINMDTTCVSRNRKQTTKAQVRQCLIFYIEIQKCSGFHSFLKFYQDQIPIESHITSPKPRDILVREAGSMKLQVSA